VAKKVERKWEASKGGESGEGRDKDGWQRQGHQHDDAQRHHVVRSAHSSNKCSFSELSMRTGITACSPRGEVVGIETPPREGERVLDEPYGPR
jgi:hypothetical protein